MKKCWKNCKIFRKLENFEEVEELLRKFYAFTSGKSGTEFWRYKEFLKKLETDKE